MSRRSQPRKDVARVVPAVSCDGLHKDYGEIVALEPLDIDVSPGEAVVLVGHNGSGKSTLLNLLAGMLEPSGGTVRIHGDDPGTVRARANRSWLPDTPVLYDDLTVEEHLRYVARLHGGGDDEPLLDDLLERLDLAQRRDQLPSQFSRGLRQKAAIAVAMCRPFSLLLIDEPFVGLDAAGRATMLELLDESHDGGATLIVATHDPEVIDRFDRGLVLADGELVHDGSADGVRDWLSPDHHDPS